jgi:hypothetical protein
MAVSVEKKLNVLKQFAVQWEHLHELALKARDKTAVISNEEDERFKKTRQKILPIYSNMKAMLGRSVDPSEHARNVLNRISSLKQVLEMPQADKNILFHRLEVVESSIYEYGEELSPGSMGVKQRRSLPIAAAAALEKGPKYSVSEEDKEESRRRLRPRTFGAVWSRLMMDPADFFDYPETEHGIRKPVGFIFVLFLLVGLIMLLCSLFLFRETIITSGMVRMFKNLSESYAEIIMYVAVWVAIYLVITTVMLFLILITSGWSQLCMRLVGGKGRYDHNYGVHCYTYAPHVFTPLYLILPVLILVPIVYQFILRIVAGAKVHKISYIKALIGRVLVLVPYLAAVYVMTRLEYKDHWNARVTTNAAEILIDKNMYYFAPKDLRVSVEKHLPGGIAYIRAMTPTGEIEGRIHEKDLEYPSVDFFRFLRLETKNMPVRISQFSSKLNIRIFGVENGRENSEKLR